MPDDIRNDLLQLFNPMLFSGAVPAMISTVPAFGRFKKFESTKA